MLFGCKSDENVAGDMVTGEVFVYGCERSGGVLAAM